MGTRTHHLPLLEKRRKVVPTTDTSKTSADDDGGGEDDEEYCGADDLMEAFGLRKIADLFLREKKSFHPNVANSAYLARVPMDPHILSGRRMDLTTLIEEETPSVEFRHFRQDELQAALTLQPGRYKLEESECGLHTTSAGTNAQNPKADLGKEGKQKKEKKEKKEKKDKKEKKEKKEKKDKKRNRDDPQRSDSKRSHSHQDKSECTYMS